MASMQKGREERAQSAAQKAADELAAARQQQGQHDAAPAGGILGSAHESARSAMDAVRRTFSSGGGGAWDGATATGGGYAEEGMEKAAETKDSASDRAWGVMDAARSAAERAREFAVEKEGARRALAGDAVARKGETNESAWQQSEDVRRRAAEKAEEERGAREPSEAEKGRSATENIYGKVRGAVGAFGEKMVMPTDVVERMRAEAAGGDGNAAAGPPKGSGREEQGGGTA